MEESTKLLVLKKTLDGLEGTLIPFNIIKQNIQPLSEWINHRLEQIDEEVKINKMGYEWKDKSVYRQSDKIRIPTIYQLELTGVDIIVHRHIDYGDDVWLFSCQQLNYDKMVLTSTDIDNAKIEALTKIQNTLRIRMELFNADIKIIDEMVK